MKVLFLSLSLALLTAGMVDAQQTKHSRKSHMKAESEKSPSMSNSTTGVPGEDTVKVNARGAQRNLNYNTGQALPPSSGEVR